MTDLISKADNAIDTAVRLLALDADTGYTVGYERDLAREVYDGIPASGRDEILAWLVESLVSDITVGAVNILDETSEATYAVIADVTARLYAAVVEQGRADRILLHLIEHEIVQREDAARILGNPRAS